MNSAGGFAARWADPIAAELQRRFADKPSSAERIAEMSQLVIAGIEDAGHDDWPTMDNPCHASFLDAPVAKRNGSERLQAPPAKGTIRSRRAGLRRTYEAAERCGATIPEPTAKDAAAEEGGFEAVLRDWQPRGGFEGDLELLEAVRPIVTEWVLSAEPRDDNDARQLMRKVAQLTVWDQRTTGRPVDATVITETNANQWLKHLATSPKGRSGGDSWTPPTQNWCRSTLSLVRRVGLAVNPAGWSDKAQRLEPQGVPRPYPEGEEFAYLRAISRVRDADPAARLWTGGSALGAGLSGTEIAAAAVEDVTIVDRGLIVEIGGDNPRSVPILSRYAPIVKEAMNAAGSGRFVVSKAKSPAPGIAGYIEVDGAGLMLPRARSTWLCAHLRGGTSLDVLRVIAGPVGADRLTALLEYTAADLDPADAARRALGL